jgi:hypothetical protein
VTTSFYIPMGTDAQRQKARGRIYQHLTTLPKERPFVVLVTEKKPSRSLQQNSTLWALYDDIIERGGETMAGWEGKDLHEFFLGEHYGWDRLEGMKRTRLKPLKRSSTMSKTQFSEHLDFIVRYMVKQGIVLELPGE